jgi:hypothetical protein
MSDRVQICHEFKLNAGIPMLTDATWVSKEEKRGLEKLERTVSFGFSGGRGRVTNFLVFLSFHSVFHLRLPNAMDSQG